MANWKPIEPLAPGDRQVYLGHVDAVQRRYDIAMAEARAHHVDVDAVLQRLRREQAVETGLLERLYDIDRGTTTLLIERGFLAELVAHGAATMSPERLVAVLNDQGDGIELVYGWVAGQRPFSLTDIRALHSVLTRNQETVDGLDALGRVVSARLTRGAWKERPNNPTRLDGAVHEYCPPVHVQVEMERLLAMHAGQDADRVHPVVQAAWLHHRFTQIHPFEDGNGRVARCLTSYVLIKGGFLPLVVRSDERGQYLDALEAADAGSLAPMVTLVAELLLSRTARLVEEFGAARLPGRGVASAEEVADALAATTRPSPGVLEAGAAFERGLAVRLHAETTASVVTRVNERFEARGAAAPLSHGPVEDWDAYEEIGLYRHLEYVELAPPHDVPAARMSALGRARGYDLHERLDPDPADGLREAILDARPELALTTSSNPWRAWRLATVRRGRPDLADIDDLDVDFMAFREPEVRQLLEAELARFASAERVALALRHRDFDLVGLRSNVFALDPRRRIAGVLHFEAFRAAAAGLGYYAAFHWSPPKRSPPVSALPPPYCDWLRQMSDPENPEGRERFNRAKMRGLVPADALEDIRRRGAAALDFASDGAGVQLTLAPPVIFSVDEPAEEVARRCRAFIDRATAEFLRVVLAG